MSSVVAVRLEVKLVTLLFCTVLIRLGEFNMSLVLPLWMDSGPSTDFRRIVPSWKRDPQLDNEQKLESSVQEPHQIGFNTVTSVQIHNLATPQFTNHFSSNLNKQKLVAKI